MKDPKRIPPMINAVKALWSVSPDKRFCQLIRNITGQDDSYNMEDEEFLQKMCEYANKLLEG